MPPDKSPSGPALRVLVTGATGLIGGALGELLRARGHRVIRVTRSPGSTGDIAWDPAKGEIDLSGAGKIDAAVHLAGENLAARRWNREQKKRILESREQGTRILSEALAALPEPPAVLVSASGVNFYEANTGSIHDESARAGTGFLSEVCGAWENATQPARDAGIRVAVLRFGVVLSPAGGAIAQMLPIFKMGLGGKLGSGRQRMSWIALDDAVEIIAACLTDERYDGAINAVAPQVVTNAEFTGALAKGLHRPALAPAPAFALRAMFGEMADATLLADIAVAPKRLEELGYAFRYPELEGALAHLLES